ncbi:hypothetical protein RRG08_020650 [Elysia crispata]|uniref:Neurotransmitter-gated ion-channel ligand-binding domain-containing protein n=1 Tax=Elysia crispata TaxID=231223 RepID=A0AAE1D9R6_9GAST|nr:hypothetical protein RRG08_020650 [Elysia crispata]
MESSLLLTWLCVFAYGHHVSSLLTKENIYQKMEMVRENSSPDLIPAYGEPLSVGLTLDLSSIREVDIARGEVEILAMRTISWTDPALSWSHDSDAGESGSENFVSSFSMNTKYLWTPDIVAYNAIHAPELLSPHIALVAASGRILFVPNERIRFRCNLENFENAEGSNCTLKYGSWTYHANILDLELNQNLFSTSSYEENPNIELLAVFAEKNIRHYACCPDAYPDIEFTLNIRKRTNQGNLFGLNWKK